MMTFAHSHKTVIVLDHSAQFLKSSKQNVEFDVFTKSRAPGIIPLAPIVKSLWTCNVEAAIEYCRIVYDVYPQHKLVRVVTSDSSATTLNSWDQTQQNFHKLMTGLAKLGPPTRAQSDEFACLPGLTEAVRLLSEPTEVQQDLLAASRRRDDDDDEEEDEAPLNRGRIICLTKLKSESELATLEECMQETLAEQNQLASTTNNHLPITHCEVVFVHIVRVGDESTITHEPIQEVSSFLNREVHISQSGVFIARKMVELCMLHFKLSATTVTGIPMKEEQNASSSANYDVELLHSCDAHVELTRPGANLPEGLVQPSKENLYTDTITLKWCTPRSTAVELHQCYGAYRITPVDVNSRPSSCLTNFLLNGRAVMLEQPRKCGTKIMTHMLASHGGEIYMHVLATCRFLLEDPPSISEGCGGKVTDYRINDFGEFLRNNRLAPVTDVSSLEEVPIERAKAQAERMTRHWPMVISDTIMFNLTSYISPLPTMMIKEVLTDDEVLECKKAIYHVVSMETRNDPLPLLATGSRGKGPKREEQYRQLWAELERFARAHKATSGQHAKVLDCLLECKKPAAAAATADDGRSGATTPGGSPRRHGSELELKPEDAAWKELERYEKMTEREKSDFNHGDTKSSPASPPVKRAKISRQQSATRPKPGATSLLALWTRRTSQQPSRHEEFAGRVESSTSKAELYIHMKQDNGSDHKKI